jgi:hypothetical protein
MTNEPVTIGGVILGLLNATLALVAGMGWVTLTVDQMALWNGFFAILVIPITYFVRKYVTPLADPKDADGMPLSGPHGEKTEAQRAALVSKH